MEYCQVSPASKLLTVIVLLLVMPSLFDEPVSMKKVFVFLSLSSSPSSLPLLPSPSPPSLPLLATTTAATTTAATTPIFEVTTSRKLCLSFVLTALDSVETIDCSP